MAIRLPYRSRWAGARASWITLGCLVLLAAPASQVAPTAEHFNYGSAGIEPEEGLPYWIWQVLPRMFADKLPGPGGLSSLGIVWEPGRELPIGFSKKRVWGMDRVAINCAFCHTGTYRTSAQARPEIVPGGPGNRISPQAYARFLEAAAADSRFNADDMLDAISKIGTLTAIESMTYRLVLIPATKRALIRHRENFAWMDARPSWGPGRIDPLNPFKYQVLGLPNDGTIGNSDMMPVWNMKARESSALHWDGLNTSFREVLLSSAIGNGASRKSIDIESLISMGEWMRQVQPPRYPFETDPALVAAGRPVFDAHCGVCHAPKGARTGTVIPIQEIGTDRHRLDTWTQRSADAFNAFASGYPWQFIAFRKTNGYVASVLDGVWLRAPYLHNGSVPSLLDLLEPAERRPTTFFRGYDVYDPARVGFISLAVEAERSGERYETARPGNSSTGHSYGTGLTPAEKQALIEYLKIL